MKRLVVLCMLVQNALSFAQEISIPKPSKATKPKMFILAVGVNQYRDSFWPALRYTVKDAQRFGKQVGKGTGYQLDSVVLTNQQATRAAIREQIQRIARQARSEDIVIVYVSSHGTLVPGGARGLEPVIVLHQTEPENLLKTGLAQRTLTDWLAPVLAKRQLLVYATCHSGLGKSRLPPHVREMLVGNKGKVAELSRVSAGRVVLAASSQGETAREDAKLQGDVYTHFLLEGLATYDRNQDGQVTALEAHDYAKQRTYKFSGGKQRPTLRAEIIGDGSIPLAGKRSRKGVPVLEGYDESYAGYQIAVNKGQKGQLPLAFPLKPGLSRIEIYEAAGVEPSAVFEVDAAEGETVQLRELFARPPFHIGFLVNLSLFHGRQFKRVYGDSSALNLGLEVGGQWRRIVTGVRYAPPMQGRGSIWTGLASELDYTHGLVFAGYRLPFRNGWGIAGGVLLGYEQARLTLKDTNTATSLSETSDRVFYGFQVEGSWQFSSYVAARGGLELHSVEHDFGRFGSLHANRTVGRIGLFYVFGSRVRRIE